MHCFCFAIVSCLIVLDQPRYNLQFDLTEDKAFTLSSKTNAQIKRMNDKNVMIHIHGFFSNLSLKNSFENLISLYLANGAAFRSNYYDPLVHVLTAKKFNIKQENTVVFIKV